MANFAELNSNNEVIRVLALDNETLAAPSGQEEESRGIDYLTWLLGGTWLQTSYTSSIRGCYAAPGMLYNPELDVFHDPQPFPSWTLDPQGNWQPPTPMPDDGATYTWQEETLSWVAEDITPEK